MRASEQTSDSKREPGFYFVVFNRSSVPAWWFDNRWWIPGRSSSYQDIELDSIGERIEHPSPQQQPDTRLTDADKKAINEYQFRNNRGLDSRCSEIAEWAILRERTQLRAEVERLKKELSDFQQRVWNHGAEGELKSQAERIKELEVLCQAFINTLTIMKPVVNVQVRETIDLAIAKAKDKLHGNGKA